jgi:hypothetical protein
MEVAVTMCRLLAEAIQHGNQRGGALLGTQPHGGASLISS